MIEQQTTYGARMKCRQCGAVGSWHRSSRAQSRVDAIAAQDLDEHTDFWHPADPE
jgi:hypothetical protein